MPGVSGGGRSQGPRRGVAQGGRGPCHRPGVVTRRCPACRRVGRRAGRRLRRRFGGGRTSPGGSRFGTTALCWSPHGALLASAGQDGLARAWDAATGAERFRVVGGSAWVERVAWSPPGDVLATAAGRTCGSGTPRAASCWTPRRTPARSPTSAGGPARTSWPRPPTAGSPSGSPTSPSRPEPSTWKGSMLTLAWSPEGRYLATGDQDATVHFWVVKTGEDLMMSGYPTKVRELSWDSVGRYLATGGGPQATVWDCSGKGPAGTTPLALDKRRCLITALAFRPSGAVLAVGGEDGAVRVWRVAKDSEKLGAANLGAEVTKVAWHPSGRSLAAATATGSVAVFDTPWI